MTVVKSVLTGVTPTICRAILSRGAEFSADGAPYAARSLVREVLQEVGELVDVLAGVALLEEVAAFIVVVDLFVVVVSCTGRSN